jgi:putative polyhydroxyalkanoate system protein
MSDIHFVRQHSSTIAEAKKKVQQVANRLAEEYDLESEWEGNTLHFTRSGVDGHIAVTAKEVTLDVKLGFLLRAFKATFEHHIARNLDEAMAGKSVKDGKAAKSAGAAKAAKESGKTRKA